MHVSTHFAIGVIFGIIFSQIYPMATTWWSFGIIILGALIADSDYIFSKFAPDHNHRMLPTHSIYFPLLLILIGVLIPNPLVVTVALAYLSHPLIDLLDWGTNCFLTGKIVGPRILLDKTEYLIVPQLMHQEKYPKWFFVKRYYHSKFVLGLEILAFISMVLGIWLLTPQYWYFLFGYFFVLGLHLYEYFTLQKLTRTHTS